METPILVNNVIEIIKKYNEKVIVILSAIGRKGFPYASDTLISSLKEIKISDKELDRVLSIGEIYASCFLSNELNKKNIKAYALSFNELGINCDNNYGNGNIISINENKIIPLVNEYQVLVLPGFIGLSKDNEVITLGRGTSDYSAIVLAKMFDERTVVLYKDCDGIFLTTKYPLVKLKPYKYLNYQEALALVDIGFNIVNRKAISLASKENIEIIVKNFSINENYTMISSIGGNNEIIGFNIINNNFLLATFFAKEVQKKLEKEFSSHHIFIKEYIFNKTYLEFSCSQSHSLLIRQLILKLFFKNYLK